MLSFFECGEAFFRRIHRLTIDPRHDPAIGLSVRMHCQLTTIQRGLYARNCIARSFAMRSHRRGTFLLNAQIDGIYTEFICASLLGEETCYLRARITHVYSFTIWKSVGDMETIELAHVRPTCDAEGTPKRFAMLFTEHLKKTKRRNAGKYAMNIVSII